MKKLLMKNEISGTRNSATYKLTIGEERNNEDTIWRKNTND